MLDPVDQRAGLACARAGIDEQWAIAPGRRRLLARVERMRRRCGGRLCGTDRRQQQRANGLVHDEVRRESDLFRDLARTAVAADVFIAEPVGRTQKLARKNIGLNLLPFARRIAFDPAGAAVDGIAAQSVRAHRDFVAADRGAAR